VRITIEDATHSTVGSYPSKLITFRVDADRPYYDNVDYIYSFRPGGERRTSPRPLGFRPTENELARESRLQLKGMFFRKIERPPAELTMFVENIFATGMVDPTGDLNGVIWPVEFVSKQELHIIKLPSFTHDEVENAVLSLLGDYFGISKAKMSVDFFTDD
jgi:hypothetical protein